MGQLLCFERFIRETVLRAIGRDKCWQLDILLIASVCEDMFRLHTRCLVWRQHIMPGCLSQKVAINLKPGIIIQEGRIMQDCPKCGRNKVTHRFPKGKVRRRIPIGYIHRKANPSCPVNWPLLSSLNNFIPDDVVSGPSPGFKDNRLVRVRGKGKDLFKNDKVRSKQTANLNARRKSRPLELSSPSPFPAADHSGQDVDNATQFGFQRATSVNQWLSSICAWMTKLRWEQTKIPEQPETAK